MAGSHGPLCRAACAITTCVNNALHDQPMQLGAYMEVDMQDGHISSCAARRHQARHTAEPGTQDPTQRSLTHDGAAVACLEAEACIMVAWLLTGIKCNEDSSQDFECHASMQALVSALKHM